uniref:Uncharacterized protein n=1 Tax=Micrurus paraensis TaxID=1970185 RepID=A0A2D4KE11_9SAUR
MWWTCTEAKKYWTRIHMWLEKMIKKDLKPETFLLGILPESYNKELKYLIINVLRAARIVFAQNWKNEKIPMDVEIIKKIMECAEMSRLTMAIREQEEKDYY